MSPTPPSSRASQCWGPKQITQSQNLPPSRHVPMKMTADTPKRNRPVPTRHIRSHTARWVPGCWDSGLREAGLHAQGHTEVDTGLRLETQVSGHYGGNHSIIDPGPGLEPSVSFARPQQTLTQ